MPGVSLADLVVALCLPSRPAQQCCRLWLAGTVLRWALQAFRCHAAPSPKIARGPVGRAGMALGSDTVRRSDSSLSPGWPRRLSFALR